MALPNKADIILFVTQTYGETANTTLQNIHTGGSNNQKGRDFENQFLLYKVFEIAATYPHDCHNQVIETQAYGFVDDICHIDYEKNIKYNYQAKNSSGAAADWTADISDRFRKQRDIDRAVFNVAQTKNCLLVSNERKAIANQQKIPPDLQPYDSSQYFEFYSDTYSLIKGSNITEHIGKLIDKPYASTYDYAVTLIHGILQSGNYRTIRDIFRLAESEAHPNPFIKFRSKAVAADNLQLPHWVLQILTDNSHCVAYSLHYRTLTVTVNEMFTATCNVNSLHQVPSEFSDEIHDIKAFMEMMLTLTGIDIQHSLNATNVVNATHKDR